MGQWKRLHFPDPQMVTFDIGHTVAHELDKNEIDNVSRPGLLPESDSRAGGKSKPSQSRVVCRWKSATQMLDVVNVGDRNRVFVSNLTEAEVERDKVDQSRALSCVNSRYRLRDKMTASHPGPPKRFAHSGSFTSAVSQSGLTRFGHQTRNHRFHLLDAGVESQFIRNVAPRVYERSRHREWGVSCGGQIHMVQCTFPATQLDSGAQRPGRGPEFQSFREDTTFHERRRDQEPRWTCRTRTVCRAVNRELTHHQDCAANSGRV